MRSGRLVLVILTAVVVGSITFAQPGRGGSQWLTTLGDAQRTSWVRTDDKISVEALSKPGFDLQWKVKLDNQARGLHGLGQGVTASGVTLFVPMSLVTGSSNNVYAIDNDIGYVVWQRHFEAPMPAVTPACAGGITSAATRIVRLDAWSRLGAGPAIRAGPTSGIAACSVNRVKACRWKGGRVVRSQPRHLARAPAALHRVPGPGRGAPVARRRPPAPAPPPVPGARGGQAAERIPGAPRMEESSPFGFLFRPSGVGYVVSSDGMLHVVGLASGKDIQRPAPFLPPNSRWSAPIAVDTTLYAATSGDCGGAPRGVWAIDLDSDAKPVVSWKTNGGDVVGAVAFTSDGTLIAAIGAGQTTGDGKANAIVALDPKTLQLKDWFTQPTAEFATGPTILRHNGKEIVAAATKDGRVLLLDAASLGGADHATPLHASRALLGPGARPSADALATWQQSSAGPASPASAATTSWILLPVTGRLPAGAPATNGPISDGAVVALRLVDAGGSPSLEAGWVSHNLPAPATPIIVNGVVFALASGLPTAATSRGTPAVLHAYDGATGKRLWNSGKAMTTFASPGSQWTGLGQIYIGTHDGLLYAFGFNDERRHTNGS